MTDEKIVIDDNTAEVIGLVIHDKIIGEIPTEIIQIAHTVMKDKMGGYYHQWLNGTLEEEDKKIADALFEEISNRLLQIGYKYLAKKWD